MKFVIHPLTHKKVLLTSPEGKKILLEYIKCFQEGGGITKEGSRRGKKLGMPRRIRRIRRIRSVASTTHPLSDMRRKINYKVTQLRNRGICQTYGLICTYNIQGTFIDSGIFEGTLKYIFETPSIFCIQEIGGLSKLQQDYVINKKGHDLRKSTIRKVAEHQKAKNGVGRWKYENWDCIQYYWEGQNKGPKDTAIMYNDGCYKYKDILSIPFEGAGRKYRPIGGVLLNSHVLERDIEVFTIHMPSLGGGVIPEIYESIIKYLNKKQGIDIFLVGDFNLDANIVKKSRGGSLEHLLTNTNSNLYTLPGATQQKGHTLDYIIHRPASASLLQPSKLTVKYILKNLLSYNIASSDHSSLGLCLEDIFDIKKTEGICDGGSGISPEEDLSLEDVGLGGGGAGSGGGGAGDL
jgi:hypothetical protein